MIGQMKRMCASVAMAALISGCAEEPTKADAVTGGPATGGAATGGAPGAAGRANPAPAPTSGTAGVGGAPTAGSGSGVGATAGSAGLGAGSGGGGAGGSTQSHSGEGGSAGQTAPLPVPDPNDNVTNPEPNEVIGFGAGTTGGAGGPEVTVTTIEELISAAASAGPLIINVKGNLVHSNASGGGDGDRIWVSSNKTIQGADSNASVDANFSNAREDESCSNIIFRNIKLSNVDGKGTGDAIEFTNGVSKIWIDHVTFGQCKDGALDFKRGADLATVSWCKFDYTDGSAGHNYANLVGHSDAYPELDRGKLRVTFHHNWYTAHAHQRMPRVRYGQVHVFNNYYAPALRPPDKTGTGPDYIIGVGVEAQILLEGSYFENPNGHVWTDQTAWYNWYPVAKCTQACAEGKIQWTEDNYFAEGTKPATWAANSDVFDPPYEYRHVLQSAANAKASVMERAGVLK